MEILVVDGMSEDDTRTVVRNLATQDKRIKLLDNPGRIVPVAMNIGIKQARGEIIVRVDGHACIAENYLRSCVHHLSATGAACVGGPITSSNSTYVGRGIALAMSFPFGVGNSRFRTSSFSGYVDTLAFGAYRREVFDQIGLFDEELVRCQDDELNYRLRKFGGAIYMTPEIRSTYFPRATLKKLWRQYFQYGYWKVRVLQKHARMMQPRQFVPGAFVCGLMLSPLTAAFVKPAWLLCAGILGAYLGANLLASLYLALKRGLRYFPLLPVVFILLHFSYGLGFLQGLLKFAGRWRES
jgi:GT2 family glycosyltransferase